MMSIKKLFLLALMVLFAASSTAMAAGVPGVTDKEVTVGISTPLSGPAALWGVTALGAKAWADYLNEKGGINGRKINVIIKDDGYNPTKSVTNLKEMKGKIFAVLALLGTAPCNANKEFFAANKVPCVLPYGNVRIWEKLPKDKRNWVFVAYPDYEDEGEYAVKYAVKNLKTKKIAMFIQNDEYGKGGLAGVKNGLKALKGKAELVAVVPHELSETSMGAHALKLKESKADTVIMYTNPKHAALISKEMLKAGYQPTRIGSFPLADPIMYAIAKKPWEGTYVCLPANSGLPGTDKAADEVAKIIVKLNPKIKGKEFLGVFGAVSMMHLAKGIENAGKDLTPESFIKGMEKIKDWKPQAVGAPVTYGPDRRHGINGSRMGQAKGGNVKALSDFVIYKPRF